MGNDHKLIINLQRDIKRYKRLRCAYSLFGAIENVKKSDDIINDLENKLLLLKLKRAK